VLLGNGDGSFQAASSYAVGDNPNSVAVADLDGDSAPDLVTANLSSSDDVTVLLNLPEPASWLMLVAGAAFLGLLYRRRAGHVAITFGLNESLESRGVTGLDRGLDSRVRITRQRGHLLVEAFSSDPEQPRGRGAPAAVGFECVADQPGFDTCERLA
jgi:hypothetical protein